MDNLAHSEIFALTLVIGTYLTSLALYKKVHISLLHAYDHLRDYRGTGSPRHSI